MAGDWIKVENVTPDKPEIDAIAEALGIDPYEALGRLVAVWIWADEQSLSGHGVRVTLSAINRASGRDGFAQAMLSVRWLRSENDMLVFPNFDRHNGNTAKERALAAKRKKKQRSRESHDENVTKAGLEKRVKEDIKPLKSPKPTLEPTSGFLRFWENYPRHEKKRECIELWVGGGLEALSESIVRHVAAMAMTSNWREEGGKYVPMPDTYLRNRRWEDGLPAAAPSRVPMN